MKIEHLRIPIHLLICAAILSFWVGASFPSTVFASSAQYTVRFKATYVSGNTGVKNVYYILDGSSSQTLLGTVSQGNNMDITFTPTFSDTVKVYVQISDNAIYNEDLYINNNLVANGNVGNDGLTYIRRDSIPPSGKITSPISGNTITTCPMMITTNVTDDNSGVAWVIYLVKFDGVWHQIATDTGSSNGGGYSTQWDCSQVADQVVDLRISAKDNAGNQADILGGDVTVTLSRGQTNPGTSTSIPTQATGVTPATMAATETMVEPSATTAVTATQTPIVLTATNTSAPPTPVPTQKSSQNNPLGIPICSSFILPLFLGLGVFLWKNRP